MFARWAQQLQLHRMAVYMAQAINTDKEINVPHLEQAGLLLALFASVWLESGKASIDHVLDCILSFPPATAACTANQVEVELEHLNVFF